MFVYVLIFCFTLFSLSENLMAMVHKKSKIAKKKGNYEQINVGFGIKVVSPF